MVEKEVKMGVICGYISQEYNNILRQNLKGEDFNYIYLLKI